MTITFLPFELTTAITYKTPSKVVLNSLELETYGSIENNPYVYVADNTSPYIKVFDYSGNYLFDIKITTKFIKNTGSNTYKIENGYIFLYVNGEYKDKILYTDFLKGSTDLGSAINCNQDMSHCQWFINDITDFPNDNYMIHTRAEGSTNHRNTDYSYYYKYYYTTIGNVYDVANDDKYVYATYPDNNTIFVLDRLNNFVEVKRIENQDNFPPIFDKPMGIAVDDDFIYIVDNGNKRVLIFDKLWNKIADFYGTNDFTLENPTDIEVDNNYFYIYDKPYTYVISKDFSFYTLIDTFISIPNNFNSTLDLINNYSNQYLPKLLTISSLEEEMKLISQLTLPKLVLNKDLTTVTIVLKKLKLNSKVLNGKVIDSKLILPKLYSNLNQRAALDNTVKTSIPRLSLFGTIIYKHNCIIKSGLSSLYIGSILYTSNIYIYLPIPKIKSNILILSSIQSKSSLLLPTLQSIFVLNSQEFTEEEFIGKFVEKIIVLHTNQNAVTEYYGSGYRFKLATLDSFYPVKMKPVEIYLYGNNIPEGNINYIVSDSATLQIPILDYNNSMKETRIKLPKGVKNRMISVEFNFNNPFTINSIHLIGYSINKRRR